MNTYYITHGARIVQEVMREEYGMPTELAVMLEHVLAGGALRLMENGHLVGSVHIELEHMEDGSSVPYAAVHMSPMDDGSAVVFEVRTKIDVEE